MKGNTMDSRSRLVRLCSWILVLSCAHSLPSLFLLNFTHPDPESVVVDLQRKVEFYRQRALTSTALTGNPIDDCWRGESNWAQNRQYLAGCGIGFGRNAVGGKGGPIYVVTDNSDSDPVNPTPGTLRYGVVQDGPLWIIFSSSTTIRLSAELIVSSFKTIDGRGSDVSITGAGCLTLQGVSNVIIHNINIHHCVPSHSGKVRSTPTNVESKEGSDGDGITIRGSRNLWIDHCSLSYCTDGLIDVTLGSTAVTISNCYFSNHDKVMLLGHSDDYLADSGMQVTVAFNHFGEALVQRMPRARHGYVHVVNNDYTRWEMYAVGGSANPTINSQGNRYIAGDDTKSKEVTKRVDTDEEVWASWNWRSEGDVMGNGAFFVQSGDGIEARYALATSFYPKSANMIDQLTRNAGVLVDSSPVGGGSRGGTPGVGGGGSYPGDGSAGGGGVYSGGGGVYGGDGGGGGGGVYGGGGGVVYGGGDGGVGGEYGGYNGMIYSGAGVALDQSFPRLVSLWSVYTICLPSFFLLSHDDYRF